MDKTPQNIAAVLAYATKHFLHSLRTTMPAVIGLLGIAWITLAQAEERIDPETGEKIYRSHAITLYDEPPKYGPDFTHFDYVNPDAPKGGRMVTGAQGAFNSFHSFINKGEAAGTASVETLTVKSLDEPFTEYGLIASEIEWPESRTWVIYHVNPKARWHDGKPITADDVLWSFETLIDKGPPLYAFYFGSVKEAKKISDMAVRFDFKEKNNRELPMILGDLPVLPKHYWAERDFEEVTLDPPLGSGPYRIKDFEAGRNIVYERVTDYWGIDHPVRVGQNNFDELETRYYLDPGSMRLAIKAGELDLRLENQAKAWAVDYEISSVEKGWLRREVFDTNTTEGMVGLVMNLRREKFQDIRVRKALNLAYDFEWTNKNMFFGQYLRRTSYFGNSPMQAEGEASGEELELLNKYRDRVDPVVFEAPAPDPKTDASGWLRENLLKASALLDEAGWVVKDMKRVNAETGEQLAFEIMIASPTMERLMLPFLRNVKRLGIDGSLRLIDTSQYIERRRGYDFDMFYSGWGQSSSPGNEQREMWSSTAADSNASRNYIGLKDPVIDEVIEELIQSPSRDILTARSRVLDRLLRAGHYVIPGWYLPADRALFWDKYDFPPATKYGALTTTWWHDEAKARKLERAREDDESITASGETSGSDRPGNWTVLVWLAVALFLGWWLIRRVMKRQETNT